MPTSVHRNTTFFTQIESNCEAIEAAYTSTTLLQCPANRKSRKRSSLTRPRHPLNSWLQENSCDPTPPSPTIPLLLHLASANQRFTLMRHKGNRNILRENTRAAIEYSADKIVPSPTRVEESSGYSEESDLEVQKSIDEQDNYAEWQRKQYTYSVKATLKADTHTGQRVRWSNRIGTENWVMDNFDINCLLMELHQAMDQHNLIGDLYEVIVFVKSAYSRATKHRLDLEALSEEV